MTERFRKEYLSNLIQRKAEKNIPVPDIGDVVLVGSDNKKRYEWPLGRIVELIPGKDDKVRVARVKTRQGIFTRPLQRLYPLEVPASPTIQKPSAVPVEIQGKSNLLKAKQDTFQMKTSPVTLKIVQDEDHTVVTRSGRIVKKTNCYGQWNT